MTAFTATVVARCGDETIVWADEIPVGPAAVFHSASYVAEAALDHFQTAMYTEYHDNSDNQPPDLDDFTLTLKPVRSEA